jgi:hypothetical protein
MTNLEIIREACVKENPDILSLKSGCKLQITESRFASSQHLLSTIEGLDYEYEIITECSDPDVFLVLTRIGTQHFKWRDIDRFCKVLGRPIHLADVLLAARESKEESLAVDADGKFWGNRGYLGVTYDLREDDLTKQSEETLAFLASLLK